MSDPRTLKRPPVVVYKLDQRFGPIPLHMCNSVEAAKDWIEYSLLDDELADVYIDEKG